MTLEYLEQYRDLKREISALEERINRLEGQKSERVADTVIGSTPTRFDPHVIQIAGYPDGGKLQRQIMKLEAIRENRIIKLLNLETEIEEYIDAVEESHIRLIIGWRYIDGWGWRKIARKMGHPKCDEQYPRRIIKRYFEKCTIYTEKGC